MITAVVTSHDNVRGLELTLAQIREQNLQPSEILVYASDTPLQAKRFEDLYGCKVSFEPNRRDWGHEKRAKGLEEATGRWVWFVNDDDDYSIQFLDKLYAEREGADIVACHFEGKTGKMHTDIRLKTTYITSGNFIVRSKLAKRVGWNHRRYVGDGLFAEDLLKEGARLKVVPELLYWHR